MNNNILEKVKIKMAISNMQKEDIVMNRNKVRTAKKIGIAACIAMSVTGVAFATTKIINKFGENSSDGVQIAVDNKYYKEINTEYKESDGISVSLESFLIDDNNFNINFKIRTNNKDIMLNEGIIGIEDLKVVNENNETVFIKGDGNATPATPEEIISLSKRKYGVDNETSEVEYIANLWSEYLNLCMEYRQDKSIPTIKELQNEEIISKDGYAKSGFIMFSDNYNEGDTMICCRLWKGKNKTGIVLDSSRLRGSIAKVFENALNFIERNTKTGWVKTENGGRDEIRSYPKEAVREALVNAIAHRDYSISGTQIDVDIYSDRIEIVSPGSWLLPKDYNEYPSGSIPSIRRNAIIAACLDVANLMERGGTGFQTMIEAYKSSPEEIQPVVSIYPGFLNLKLFDRLYRNEDIELDLEGFTDAEKVMAILKMEGPKPIKELQTTLNYRSRSQFLNEVINPLMEIGKIYRDGKPKSPTALIKIKR